MASKAGLLSRATDAVLPPKVIKLITFDGSVIDSFQIPASREAPAVVIFGIADAEKTFVRDKKTGEYHQASHCHSPMPPQTAPFNGGMTRRA